MSSDGVWKTVTSRTKFTISSSSQHFLKKGGWLYLEHSPEHAEELKFSLQDLGYMNITQLIDLNGDKRAIKALST